MWESFRSVGPKRKCWKIFKHKFTVSSLQVEHCIQSLLSSTCCTCFVSCQCLCSWLTGLSCQCCHVDERLKDDKLNNGSNNDLPSFPCHPDEMYELLSKLPESVAYTCTKCTERQPAEWRTALERELQGCVRHVLTALLNSRTSSHLLRYRQVRHRYCCYIYYKHLIETSLSLKFESIASFVFIHSLSSGVSYLIMGLHPRIQTTAELTV